MILDERCEKAIRYLAETDEKAADATVEVKRCEDEIKAIKSAIILRVEGAIAIREALAETNVEMIAARNKYHLALLASERIYNKRKTEERITDLWRSVNSNRRHGIT